MEISEKAKLPTIFGEFELISFKDKDKEHLAIFTKKFDTNALNLRLHSECLTGDTIGSLKCDCRDQLHYSLNYIDKNSGMVLYLRQEGRGIGLFNKINAYALQDKGYNTIEANNILGFKDDERDFSIVNKILNYFEIKEVNLMTNNPDKINILKAKVKNVIPMKMDINEFNKDYLEIKKTKMGHLL